MRPLPPDPDKLLDARVRVPSETFEARFDALEARLLAEPRRSSWPPLIRALVLPLVVAASLALAIFQFLPAHGQFELPPDEMKVLIEMAALDESLSSALGVTDDESLDVLLHLSLHE